MFDTEVGAFLRLHVFRGFFIQGEMAYGWDQEPVDVDPNARKLIKGTFKDVNPYVGIGYNFSQGYGGPGQEIGLMYNFRIANDPDSYQQPIQYRLAFTYGF